MQVQIFSGGGPVGALGVMMLEKRHISSDHL